MFFKITAGQGCFRPELYSVKCFNPMISEEKRKSGWNHQQSSAASMALDKFDPNPNADRSGPVLCSVFLIWYSPALISGEGKGKGG